MTNIIVSIQAHRRLAVTISIVALATIALSSLLIDSSHAHTWMERHMPCFWSLFGFAAASAIIGFTRWFGRSGIQASPDFYTCSAATLSEEE